MARNSIATMIRTARKLPRLGWAITAATLLTGMLLALAPDVQAQSSPLTIKPSTSSVGINNTDPGYTLDVSGTVNATSFRGDGSQITNLPSSGGITAVDKVATDTTVSNTALETVLYSFLVPANTLGTSNRLRLVIQGEDRETLCVDCDASYVFRLKYGGITLFASPAIVPSTTLTPFKAEFLLSGDGTTSSQIGLLYPNLAQGTAAVDSTAAQTLQVTVDWDVANTNHIVRLKHAVLELLK